jgi:Protein of unknown function (DUF3040)
MALSMEEERILAEIEQELARSEPALAAYLSAFGRARRAALPRSPRQGLHAPRMLVAASLVALVLLTVIPVVVFALVSLHPARKGQSSGRSAIAAQHHAVPPHPVMSAPR